jgi:hypothetical protein
MKTLSDLHWFSFSEDWEDAKTLTIWQAIGHILSHTPKTQSSFEQYLSAINQLEFDSVIEDIIDYNASSGKTIIVFKNGTKEKVDFTESDENDHRIHDIALAPEDIQEHLDLLNANRQALVESIQLPSLIYRLLSAELESLEFDLPSILETVADEHQPLIKKTSLSAWRDSKQLSSLQLVHNDPKAKRKAFRADAMENHLKIVGMLLHLLEEAAPEKYTKKKHQPAQEMSKNKVTLAMIDRVQEDTFPCNRSVQSILKDAENLFKEAVTLKTHQLDPRLIRPGSRTK